MNGHHNDVFGAGYVRMIIKDYRTSIRVGVHPSERQGPQPVVINVEMFAKDPGKLSTQSLGSVVNYDYIRDAIGKWSGRSHIDLLETFLEELVQLCFSDPRVDACRVSIMKPEIFPEATEVGVELFRVRK